MPGYHCQLIKREEVAENTLAFYLQRPSDFNYRAGQFVDMTLTNPRENDAAGSTRTFTLASSPYENHLMIATRIRDSAFKRNLRNAPLKSEFVLEGPMGSFTLHTNAAKPAVFLAGGIGITPFYSMVRQASQDRLSHRLFLFYSNRRPEDAPFMGMLYEQEKANPNFKFVPTMTQIEKSHWKWNGETGTINKEMLVKYVRNLVDPIYYIAGPPRMVAAMSQMLITAGVNEDDIRSEDFGGY